MTARDGPRSRAWSSAKLDVCGSRNWWIPQTVKQDTSDESFNNIFFYAEPQAGFPPRYSKPNFWRILVLDDTEFFGRCAGVGYSWVVIGVRAERGPQNQERGLGWLQQTRTTKSGPSPSDGRHPVHPQPSPSSERELRHNLGGGLGNHAAPGGCAELIIDYFEFIVLLGQTQNC